MLPSCSCSLTRPDIDVLDRSEQLLIRDLFGLAPRRDYLVSPPSLLRGAGLVSVALIRTLTVDGNYPLRRSSELGLSSLDNWQSQLSRATTRSTYTIFLLRPDKLMPLLANLSASLFKDRSISFNSILSRPFIRCIACSKSCLIFLSFTRNSPLSCL